MEDIIVKNGKELRCGYTTGSCAAAAASAALEMIFTGKRVNSVMITLPSNDSVILDIDDSSISSNFSSCTVIKDGGDDPDVTTGAEIIAKVTLNKNTTEINITGGKGVGRITAKGLRCPVGEPAINPVPRKMITENVKRIINGYGYNEGVDIEISVPKGEEIAKKTYNPRLGIVGGISILGTTGIVEPMSEKALIDTIKIVIDKKYQEDSETILIAPGNYGKDFCREYLGLDIEKAVAVSNYIGEALDYIKYKGFKRILFVGHTGKLIKIAAGVMNTHSSYADGRMEIIGIHSALCGADKETLEKIMGSVTTDNAFEAIKDKAYFDEVKDRILEKVMYHLNFRLKNQVEIEVVMFTTDRDNVIKSKKADSLIKYFVEEN